MMAGRYVITGTDTDVGKTVIAAGLAGALGAHYWKPIQAGLEEGGDSGRVAELAGLSVRSIIPEAYRLTTPCSPHEAARLDGVEIDVESLALPDVVGPLVVEGAGGLMVPINRDQLVLDLIDRWALPTILVVRCRLGMINHSLLAIEALRGRWIEVAGALFVGNPDPASEAAIEELGCVAHLGRLPWLDPLNAQTLAAAFASSIRLERLRA